jgi:hypothetical protein
MQVNLTISFNVEENIGWLYHFATQLKHLMHHQLFCNRIQYTTLEYNYYT